VVRALIAGDVLYLIASGKAGFDVSAGFASNGYGEYSPGGYSLRSAPDARSSAMTEDDGRRTTDD